METALNVCLLTEPGMLHPVCEPLQPGIRFFQPPVPAANALFSGRSFLRSAVRAWLGKLPFDTNTYLLMLSRFPFPTVRPQRHPPLPRLWHSLQWLWADPMRHLWIRVFIFSFKQCQLNPTVTKNALSSAGNGSSTKFKISPLCRCV